jgi:hypothetical protein
MQGSRSLKKPLVGLDYRSRIIAISAATRAAINIIMRSTMLQGT